MRRAFGYPKLLAVGTFDRGFGALVYGVERLKVEDLIAFQGFVVLHAANDCEIDGVFIFRPRGQCGGKNDLVCRDIVHSERNAECQLILRKSAGLV